ncbi:Fic family protein [Fodinicurvata fenggangensis]|uniref:Fic family protein n=1 Tax=Fodinicurvata fenggangensis TaxID=1121830 RepID=UPI00054EA3C1|nr:Fic family protein [Fodinicurvata fenggangensis]
MTSVHPSGHFVAFNTGQETTRAFVPEPLPPTESLRFERLYEPLEAATLALGKLDGISSLLPDTPLFLYMYIRKEALLSSQIEGTQSSLSDLLLYENQAAPGVPIDDTAEVANYVAAMDHGLLRLREGFPISLRLIREIHDVLLSGNRGADKNPGEFRRSQNWVGGPRPSLAAYVPPPPDRLMECMGELEKFIHQEDPAYPVLVKAGLVHVQFESIHPFLDGNGRLGRLLITFLLCASGLLREPTLYLSLYLKKNREEYYELLQAVREKSAWEEWLIFFLKGIRETSQQAFETAQKIIALFEKDQDRIEKLGRQAGSTLRVHQYLQSRPLVSIPSACQSLNLTAPTVTKAMNNLQQLGIVSEITGQKRSRMYVYDGYLRLLSEGTEPL